MKGLILFDVDGTLVTNSVLHRDAFVVAIKNVINKDIVFDLNCTGMIDTEIVQGLLHKHGCDGFSLDDVDKIMQEMVNYYQKNYKKDPVKILVGVKELLQGLKEEEYCLGLLTGNIEAIAYLKLSLVGIDKFFRIGAFGNEADNRLDLVKKAIVKANELCDCKFDNKNIFIIGDTINDERTAKENGVNCVAVGTGLYDYNVLGMMNPTLYFKDFSDYKQVIKNINHVNQG